MDGKGGTQDQIDLGQIKGRMINVARAWSLLERLSVATNVRLGDGERESRHSSVAKTQQFLDS